MKKNSQNTKIISISLSDKILINIDDALSEMGYISRSELIRDSVRSFLNEKSKLNKVNGIIEGVMTIIYDDNIGSKVSTIRHEYTQVLKSFIHSDFIRGNCSCCEVILFSGNSSYVIEVYNKLKSLKGVWETNIYIASE
jgi:metal-responsive CopG/Arc/MetJ family transcriptional regulator